jgi:methylmalonyl-CoA mutase, C-terminal domain
MKMKKHKRILLAKIGLDCHDTGIDTVEPMMREAGYEVTYMGLYNTAKQVVNAAIEKKVDAIGISFISGQDLTQMRELMAEIDSRRLSTKVFCGGVIPSDAAEALKKMGVSGVIKPGTSSKEVVAQIELAWEETSKKYEPCMAVVYHELQS